MHVISLSLGFMVGSKFLEVGSGSRIVRLATTTIQVKLERAWRLLTSLLLLHGNIQLVHQWHVVLELGNQN
jgi:hypothetical protein